MQVNLALLDNVDLRKIQASFRD